MNADVLLEHFHRLGDAPDAVPRLRRFILDLAVQGKLVEQSKKDESVDRLLDRTRQEMVRLVAKKELKAVSPLEDIDEDAVPFKVPQGWRIVRMGWLAMKLGAGSTPLGGKTVYQDEGIPFLRSQNVHDEGLRLDDVALIPRAVHERMSGTHVQRNDILLNITGASIGRCALVPNDFKEGNVSQHVAIIRLFDPAHREFIHLSLRSPFFQKVIDDVQVGVSREGLSMQGLKKFPMLVPPLPEQHRIVAKVDELMALCDRLEAAQQEQEQRRTRLTAASWQALTSESEPNAARFALEQLPALTTRPQQIAALRQTILDLAVRGRLVKQDATDEPAEVLLKRIAKEKETIEGPIELPSSWAWVRIGNILDGDSQNGFSKKPDDAPDGIPILRISAGTVRTDALVAEEEHKLIGGITAKQREQYGLREGDLLACRFNGNKAAVGRLTLFTNYLDIDPIYPDKLIRLRLDKRLCIPALLRSFGQSTIVRQGVEAYCATTVGNWGISATNLKEVLVPLPPLAEQRRIVAKVDELMRLCDKLEVALVRGEEVKGRLLEAVLQSEKPIGQLEPDGLSRKSKLPVD